MYFDFDDRYQDVEPVGSAINRRDGVLLSIVTHAVLILLAMVAPRFLPEESVDAAEVEPLRREPERPQFVFVQPRVDLERLNRSPSADASDKDRVARSPERSPMPAPRLPFSRGSSPEKVEALPDARARGRGPAPESTPEVPASEVIQRAPEVPLESQAAALPRPQPSAPQGGSLGDALRNLQKYVEREQYNNPKPAVQDLGPLQFDTKGVEFGPWIRRFIAQVRRNWFIPYAAMSLRGRVVLQFNVHKDGRITDLAVVRPSDVTSFNTSAFNALAGSNPTEPLPAEYPDDKAFFTVTFYYNEPPDSQRQ
jgi:TonB family protein